MPPFHLKKILSTLGMLITTMATSIGQTPRLLPNFTISDDGQEQIGTFNFPSDVIITINAPAPMRANRLTSLVLYALPNGNSTAWTIGKRTVAGEDWHYEIQHIGAQTRFVRAANPDRNYVTIYLETTYKSWPAWSKNHSENKYALIHAIVDSLRQIFTAYPHELVLNGHSGGGNFIFNFIDGSDSIPAYVERIAFIESDYNYSPEKGHGAKLVRWLNAASNHYLCVLAYNDSVALFDGKPVVSATGGTWYRSKLMYDYLARHFQFTSSEDSAFVRHFALGGRIQFWLKQNPTRAILHTFQVERNGFIHSLLAGTPFDQVGYLYYGDRAYEQFIR